MIRQAKSYLRGAASGTVVVVVSVLAFVAIVIAISSGEVPLNALGLGKDQPVTVATAAKEGNSRKTQAAAARRTAERDTGETVERRRAGAPDQRSDNRKPRESRGEDVDARLGTGESGPARPRDVAPPAAPPVDNRRADDQGKSNGGGGNGGRGGQNKPGKPNSDSGVNPGLGGSGGPNLADDLNDTVGVVDQALGSPLEKTGVTEVTKQVTDRVLGPDSTVGQVTERVTETVRGTVGGLTDRLKGLRRGK